MLDWRNKNTIIDQDIEKDWQLAIISTHGDYEARIFDGYNNHVLRNKVNPITQILVLT